ncbi:MAG: nickel-dependent hydrogenase large subunit [Pseudomonadota bacterium]
MTAPLNLSRRYTLVFQRSGNAQVVRTGPVDILAIGRGQQLSSMIPIVGLLFPICPRAHQAALLSATENAAGMTLTTAQQAARDCAVLAEAISSAVWRSALSWPKLAGSADRPQIVAQARAASDAIEAAIFPNGWARPGTADIKLDLKSLEDASVSLRKAVRQAISAEELMSRAPEDVRQLGNLKTPPSLGTEILDTELDPATHAREETPRCHFSGDTNGSSLSDWFLAQEAIQRRLLDELDFALSQLRNEKASEPSEAISGTGIGTAITARGRLRHIVSLSDGRIENWRSDAPTDWNFAPKGAVAKLATGLVDQEQIEVIAPWLIAAYDPCAPCTAKFNASVAHA